MADDLARLQRQRAQAEAAGDQAAVARFDARIQAASAGPAAADPAAAASGPVLPSEAAQAEQASRDAPLTDSSVGGVLKSLATGVRRFGEGIVAAPGNLITAEADLADKYLPQLGKRTWRQRIDEPSSGGPGVATSPEVTAAADEAVKAVLPKGGVDAVKDITQHEPQGLPEEIAQTAGEFAHQGGHQPRRAGRRHRGRRPGDARDRARIRGRGAPGGRFRQRRRLAEGRRQAQFHDPAGDAEDLRRRP
jgi:hypothetical protein